MWSQDGLTTTGHYVLPNANSTSQAHDDPLPSPFITAPKRPFMLAYPGGFDLSAEHGTATATQHQQVQTPNTPQVAQVEDDHNLSKALPTDMQS